MRRIVLFLILSLTTMTMMAKTIETEILIKDTPENVWAVLVDFEKYPLWNPFIKSLTGEVMVGNKIEIKLPDMSFKPEVLVFDVNKELRWLGQLLFKGILDGEHTFVLVDNGDGTTTLKHSERFTGIATWLIKSEKLKQSFENMNLALKNRVESIVSNAE